MPLQQPQYFRNGTQTWIDSDLMDKIWNGDPTVGWEGDPNMFLFYDNKDHRVYLTGLDDHGEQYIVMRSKPDVSLDTMQICRMLVEHDRNRGYNLAKELDANDAKVDADKRANDNEALEDVAKKLAWGFRKDLH